MASPPILPQRAESFRRAVRWLGPAVLLALAPKCILCLLTYAGIGVALGLGGTKFCGAPNSTAGSWTTAWLAFGLILVAIAVLVQFALKMRSTVVE